jgi:Cu(I)/Ag(I) efflux system membrane fusion protein
METLTDKLKNKKNLTWLIVILLVGLVLGYWLRGEVPIDSQSNAIAETASAERDGDELAGANIYVCPMMCVPPMEKPGDCPVCGMELLPVSDDLKEGRARLKLSPEAMTLAQIQVAPVERRFVSTEVRLFGQIEYDPVHISYASAYVPGVIDRIYVKRAGQTVRWGDPLFDIYSPEIFYIEQELLQALKTVPAYYASNVSKSHVRKRAQVLTDKPLDFDKASPKVKAAYETLAAMRLKLTLIGMEKKDIDELMKRGEPTGIATIYAQRGGTVIEQKAFKGTYVNTGTQIFAIANPKFIWVKLDAYESDYAWIRKGQEVTFETDAYPGEKFKGKVVYIDPIFNSKSRTFDVGVIFPYIGRKFWPSMYVRAVIHSRLTAHGNVADEDGEVKKAPLVIPASAPLITGKRAVVYVAMPGESGVFEGREVALGPRAKDYYVILEGLKEGEKVVVNGNFKIDSQIQILAKSSMMSIKGGHSADEHHHHGGSKMLKEKNRRNSHTPSSRMKMDKTRPMAHDHNTE